MGLVDDILKGLPVNPVLREKITELEAKYGATETENAILKDDLREANLVIQELKQQVKELTHKDDLAEIEVQLIHRIANTDYDVAVPENFSRGLNLSKTRLEYHIHRLKELSYIRSGIINNLGVHYEVSQKGRELLLEKDLL